MLSRVLGPWWLAGLGALGFRQTKTNHNLSDLAKNHSPRALSGLQEHAPPAAGGPPRGLNSNTYLAQLSVCCVIYYIYRYRCMHICIHHYSVLGKLKRGCDVTQSEGFPSWASLISGWRSVVLCHLCGRLTFSPPPAPEIFGRQARSRLSL